MAATSLLISESPLTVLPRLAVEIGLNEAIFLQQVQYWISREAGIYSHGHRWIYNTVRQWQEQFPFWSESTIKRTISSLEKQQVLFSATVGDAFNKTKAYTINYDRIEEIGQRIAHEEMRASIESADRRVTFSASAASYFDEEPFVYDDGNIQESQNVKIDEPIEEVNLTQQEGQSDPIEEVNLTQSNRPAENPATTRV